MPGTPLARTRYSLHTQSRKTVLTKTASVSFHSSYFSKFILDSTQVKVWSSSECKAISVHRLLAFTSKPLSLYILGRSEEHTYELQSLMRISYAVFCLNQQKKVNTIKIIYKA